MNNPYTIEKVVLEILKANEEARNDDMKLYLLVCEAVNPYPTCDRDIGSFSFSSVMNHYRELRLPHFESVRRSRAKIQAEILNLPVIEAAVKGERNWKYSIVVMHLTRRNKLCLANSRCNRK